MTTPTTTLYRGGHIHSPCDPHASALLVTGDQVSWVGSDADAPSADRTVDLDGGLVTPAFVDAHVHTTHTGFALTELDLSGARSAAQLLDAVAGAASALPDGAVVLGHGWDESTWDAAIPAGSGAGQTPPEAAVLERAAGGRSVYLTQASMHSALCAGTVLAAAAGATGYHPSGWLRRDANHAARKAAVAGIGAVQRAEAQRAALRRAAALGIGAVHECGVPGLGSEEDFTEVLARSGDGAPEVYGYWGELGAAKAKELGAVGAGGDLFADGALGARTAHLREPYHDEPGTGHAYLSVEQVRDHLLDCHRHGLPGGFHAIGDAALATVLAGFAAAAEQVGLERVRAARHRIEHAELVDREMIGQLVEFGVVTSAQPAFDRLWGGEHQMYAQRLGTARALASNPLGAMHSVGVALAFGSDSPVTPLDPWGSVRAAAWHHNPAHRVSVRAAFAAHTRGGWRAVGQDPHGVLTPGAPASFAVWHTPAGLDGTLPALLAPEPADRGPHDPTPLPQCRRTVLRGATIYDSE
ncbi:MAG: amidohydrolase family protein [Micromonosporaceae bacterium]|nr:amidohydrolase family protein [Micromonosporaceae bacterium]